MSFNSGFTQAINIKLIGSSNLKNSMGGAVSEVNKLKSAFTDLRSAGLKLMGVGVGISTAFIGPVVQASKFNTQLIRTGKLAGVGAKEMKVLGDVAMELGAKTLFTAQQIAMGQEELVRLGFGMEVVGNKAGAFGEVLNFASAHQIEMSDSAQMLIGTLRSFNQPLTDSQKVSDMFSTVLSKTGFSMDGLTEALKMANTSIPAFNQSIETQLTLLGILANRQQGSSIGARRLSTAMTMIYTQQDKINKLFGTDTFKVYDEATGKQKNFIDVIFDMKKAMKGFSDEQQAVMLKDLVGTIGLKGLVPLLKAPVEEFKKLGIAINEGAISTSGFADAVRKTPKGMWLLMKSAISGVTMEIGQHLMPIATATMKVVTMLSDKFLGFMKAHPILAKVVLITTALIGVLAILGGGLFLATSMLGLMMTSTSGLTTSLISMAATMTGTSVSSMTLSTALGVLSGTLWSILWPIGAIILGVVLLYKAWQHNFLGLKDTVDAMWTAIKPFFTWIGSVFKTVSTIIKSSIGNLKSSITDWYKQWNKSFTGMKSPIMAFAGVVAYVVGFVVGILKTVFNAVKPYLLPLFSFLAIGFTGVFKVIGGVLKIFLSVFSGVFRIIGSILKGDFSGALSAVKSMVKGVFDGVITIFKGLGDVIKGVLGVVINLFKITFVGAFTIVKSALYGIWSLVKNVFSFIFGAIQWVIGGAIEFGKIIVSTLASPFLDAWNLIKSIFSGELGLADALKKSVKVVFSILTTPFRLAFNVIGKIFNISNFGDSIISKLTAVFGKIFSILIKPFKSGWGFIVSVFSKVKSFFGSVFIDAFKTVFNTITTPFISGWFAIKNLFQGNIGIVDALKKIGSSIIQILTTPFRLAFNLIGRIFNIKGLGEKIISTLSSIFGKVINIISIPFIKGWEIIKSVFSKVFGFFSSIFTPVFEWLNTTWQSIGNMLSGVWSYVFSSFTSFVDGLHIGISSVVAFFSTAFDSIKTTATTIFTSIGNSISSVWSGIKSMFTGSINSVIDKANSLIGGVNLVTGKIGIPAIPEIPNLAVGIMDVPQDMLAVIHKGEAVIPADQNPFTKGGSSLTQSVINNNAYNNQNVKSVSVDRSIKDITLQITIGSGNPDDFKSKLMEVFEDLAGKSDTIEVAV